MIPATTHARRRERRQDQARRENYREPTRRRLLHICGLSHTSQPRRPEQTQRRSISLVKRRLPRTPRCTISDRHDASMGIPGTFIIRSICRLLPFLRQSLGRHFNEKRALSPKMLERPEKRCRSFERNHQRLQRKLPGIANTNTERGCFSSRKSRDQQTLQTF